MGTLAIRQVHYAGDRFHFTSPEFGPGLSIIEGANGTGKTTFFNRTRRSPRTPTTW